MLLIFDGSMMMHLMTVILIFFQRLGRKALTLPAFHNTEANLDMIIPIIVGSDHSDVNIINIHYPRIDVFVIVAVEKVYMAERFVSLIKLRMKTGPGYYAFR